MHIPNHAKPRITPAKSKEGWLLQQFSPILRLIAWYKGVSLSYLMFVFLGTGIIIFAVIELMNHVTLQAFFSQLTDVFSTSFVVIFTVLVVSSLLAIAKIQNNHHNEYWSEVGLQLANAISALALTFTLLGISLGIGSLSEQPLTPANVQILMNQLTQHFSMAFMTTVVGLPTATVIRAIVSIRFQKVLAVSTASDNTQS